MSKPISLEEVRKAPQPDVVRYLEMALEDARAGRIRGIALCCTLTDGHTISAFESGDSSFSELYLAVRRLENAMISPDD